MNLVRRIWNWCRRFRHRCGYGVHSPSDFFLITSVVYEKLPYYAYRELEDNASTGSSSFYRRKVNRLLFRLVNYFCPSFLIEVGRGDGTAFRYIQAARTSMEAMSMEGGTLEETLLHVEKAMQGRKTVDLLHVADTPYYAEVVEKMLPYLEDGSCMIVGGIYASKAKQAWWKRLLEDERVRITFDLYDIGIVLFDSKRYKQDYIVNFF